MFKRISVAITLLAFAFTGCAGVNANLKAAYAERGNPLQALQDFTMADLDATVALAQQGQDESALMCMSFIRDEAKKLQAMPKGQQGNDVAGPLSALQKFRNGIHGAQSASSQNMLAQIDLHCAAYRDSVNIDIIKGSAMVGSVVGSGGANIGSILPALKALAPLIGLNFPVLP